MIPEHKNTGNKNASKPEEARRVKRIMLNCTHGEFAAYVKAAGLQGVTVQQWARDTLTAVSR